MKALWIHFGKESPSCSTVANWTPELKSGKESIGIVERPRQPEESTNDKTAETVSYATEGET
jgi:hypothetical protein